MFLPHFDVFCDLILFNRHMVTCNPFVLYNEEQRAMLLTSPMCLIRKNQSKCDYSNWTYYIKLHTCTATVFNIHLTRQRSFALMLVEQFFFLKTVQTYTVQSCNSFLKLVYLD